MHWFRAVDHFIRRYPSKMDIRKDDGFTPLHLAALNSHLDVVTSFAEHVSNNFCVYVYIYIANVLWVVYLLESGGLQHNIRVASVKYSIYLHNNCHSSVNNHMLYVIG